MTIAWAIVQAVQLVTWVIAWIGTIGDAKGRLPVMIAAVPAMYGTLVYSLFVETWVLGHPDPWTPRVGAYEALWFRYWEAMALTAPVIVAVGLWGLWMPPRQGFSLSARIAGLLSTAAAISALLALGR